MQPRTVSLVLMTAEGRLLGQTPPLAVALPWWQEVSDVVCAAEARYEARVTVLRLLASERPRPPGGWVAYLAEIEETPSEGLQPVSEELAQLARRSSPCRAAWAQPGGQRESLAWARAVWPAYMARVDDCALPDVLVHGDFHPGNVRASESRITILDWGDSFLGNPAFDLLRLSEGAPPAIAAELLARWSARWRECQKHCDPERAATLLRPLVPLRAAATYARFLDHIEAAEHPFHAVDVTEQLQLAESMLAAG